MLDLIFEIIGTVAFAVSGALVGIKKKMDIFGVTMLGVITAVGGGILRDIILGVIPPAAFQNPLYALLAIGVSVIVFLPAVRRQIDLHHALWVFTDSLGLATFTVLGVQTGAAFHNLFLSVFLGTVTGVGGGVIRDICAGELPRIFVKHFYACACILGALLCALLYGSHPLLAEAAGFFCTLILRLCAAKFKWNLPRAE